MRPFFSKISPRPLASSLPDQFYFFLFLEVSLKYHIQTVKYQIARKNKYDTIVMTPGDEDVLILQCTTRDSSKFRHDRTIKNMIWNVTTKIRHANYTHSDDGTSGLPLAFLFLDLTSMLNIDDSEGQNYTRFLKSKLLRLLLCYKSSFLKVLLSYLIGKKEVGRK